MSTPVEHAIIHERIFPAILGTRRFRDVPIASAHMAYNEVAVFEALLSHLKPRCAIEVGTETGATLDIIARHSTRAISIDTDPQVKAELGPAFTNAEFITGSSHDVLPVLLRRLADEHVTPDFIFVDGDHSADGVRRDLEFILTVRPLNQMLVLMHDSFNPGCRQGIQAARWSRNLFCHFVELDFVPGILHPNASCFRQMWGGLGFALFLPERRRHSLEVKATHQLMFEAALRSSVYAAGDGRVAG